MEKINIEEIMEEIRKEIKEKGYTNDLLSFEDVVESNSGNKTLEEYYDILNATWNIPAYRMLSGGKGPIGRLKVFVKKVLRKIMKFYVEPIASEQTEFNANNVRLLNLINSYMELNDRRIEMLESELEQMKQKLRQK